MAKAKKFLSHEEIYGLKMARWKARTDLGWLCREVLGYKDVDESVHQPIVDILQKFPVPDKEQFDKNDEWNGKTWVYKPITPMPMLEGGRRVLILDPRSHLKTTINAQAHTIQWILNYPDISMAVWQSNLEKAELILKEIKGHFQTNPVFRRLFPEHCPQTIVEIRNFGTQAEFTSKARSPRNVRRESTVMTLSIDKGTAGLHFDVMKFSDIVEPENVKTRERMISVIDAFHMAENLLVAPRYWIDVEGTRYAFGDLYGKLIQQWLAEKVKGIKHEYKVHVRSVYKRLYKGEIQTQFTPDTLDDNTCPFATNEKGEYLPWWERDRNGMIRFTYEDLEAERAKNSYIYSCTPGYAPVLMGDLTEKFIETIQIGEEVVGYTTNHRSEFIKTKVLDKGWSVGKVFRYFLEDGTFVDCTEDHLWYAGSQRAYKGHPYRQPSVGKKLYRVYQPIVLDKNWYYLAGLFDGEGSVSKSTALLTITQSSVANPEVHARISEILTKLNIPYKTAERAAKDNHKESTMFRFLGGRTHYISLVCADCAKAGQLQKLFWRHPKRIATGEKIVKREFLREMPVFWLQTGSGNYVSQGVASKNCQKLNNPVGGVEGREIFPVGKTHPIHITRENFRRNVRVAYRTITVDTAETVNTRSNFTAIVITAWDGNGRAWIEEIIHGKFLPNETIQKILGAAKKYKPRVVKIEETSFVRGLEVGLRREMDLTGQYWEIEFVKRDTQVAKIERIQNTLQPHYLSGLIRFVDPAPGDEKAAETYQHMLTELKTFPLGETDDILDALADQFQGKDWFGRETARPTLFQDKDYTTNTFLGIEDPFDPANGYYLPDTGDSEGFYSRTGGL